MVEATEELRSTLKYTAIDAQPSWFLAIDPVKGHLASELHESCGLVSFMAVPKELGEM